MRPKMLDAYCGQGGAAVGYHRAGFDLFGVDSKSQRRYPFGFMMEDALEAIRSIGYQFDVIHASPPCQAYTLAANCNPGNYPDLIESTREALVATGKPWVMENVTTAPLRDDLTLCGCMFDLGTYRPRLFESNVPLTRLPHQPHVKPNAKMGRPPLRGEMMHVVGNFSGAQQAREAMGIDWMNRDGIAEAVPPAYTEHVGADLMRVLR